jgi:hypothetical protein
MEREMSGFLLTQNPDGADFQAQAVLAYLRYFIGDGIEESWNGEQNRYMAEPHVTRYDNAREQGYVVYLKTRDYKHQINIAFYEHRNSDAICAVVSDAKTLNAPRQEDITEHMRDKYDTTHDVGPGEAYQMARWIADKLTDFWAEHHPKETLALVHHVAI